ncbi:hypothetical protein CCR75_004742 [Bremia lactucae]|uniref:C3H1-type domain-containing protein n=1 Tax=Bremia lactucae TaxID=4779 RepID=A0A976IJV5_BRELC|nr:hypothetical protein CCR75_004742 [Bremia lactucae]
MEKGGVTVAKVGEQLHGKELDDDKSRILRELQTSRLEVHELQQVVEELRDEQRLAKQRMALHSSLSTKLKRELVDERLALLNARNEIQELRLRRSGEGLESGHGRSPHSSSLQDQCDNLWSSPNKPIPGSTGDSSGTGPSGGASSGSNIMAFKFFSSTAPRREGDHGADDEELPSPSSSTQTLRNTLMGQFLPSTLLDSPQLMPKQHARSFALSEDKAPPSYPLLQGDMEPLSLTASSFPEHLSSPSLERDRFKSGDGRKETSYSESGRYASVSLLQLSMLSELFDGISIGDLELILRRFDGQESAAIDYILHNHPSFNPVIGTGGRVETGVVTSPSRTSSFGQGKASLHRSSSQSGSTGPPLGPSSNWKTEICMYYMQGKCNKTRRTCSFAHGESDLVRPTGLSTTVGSSKHAPNYKTRLCQAFENGTCIKSRRDCLMAHGISDLREGGSGSVGPANPPNLQATTPRLQSYKTELCYYFLKGNCNYSKDECRFAHGQSDLRTVESNTAQIVAATTGSSGYPTSPVPLPPSMEKQLQLQHQYQQQYYLHHHPPAMPQQQQQHPYPPQPPPAQQQQMFVPQQQIQMQHPSRGSGGQFAFQHQQYDIPQQQPSSYMHPPPSQFRYLKSMEDKRLTSGGRQPLRRDSGSSWSSFDASGLPPSEY